MEKIWFFHQREPDDETESSLDLATIAVHADSQPTGSKKHGEYWLNWNESLVDVPLMEVMKQIAAQGFDAEKSIKFLDEDFLKDRQETREFLRRIKNNR